MDATSQQSKRRDHILSALNVAIETLNLAKEISSPTPAKAVFGSASVLLTMIRDSKANKTDYVELGQACADACLALKRGMNGREVEQFSQSVVKAIEKLEKDVADIQTSVEQLNRRNFVSRHFQARNDKDAIAGWKSDLIRILNIFNTELAANTHVVAVDIQHGVTTTQTMVSNVQHGVANTQNMVADIHRTIVDRQEGSDDDNRPTQRSISGETPPPRPRACFGREELIEEIVGIAASLSPIALIGPGGIGKTSIALAVLHHPHIKEQFGDDRRFIRCDQFPASCPNLLARLSKAIGAGVENPTDLTPLRPYLSSKKMMIVFDNAESILDSPGTDGQEIYRVVGELSQFENICLAITSRITTVPPDCKTFDIPTLSTSAAHEAFYNIYKHCGRSDSVNEILEQLEFHPLSVVLLATVAHQNRWDGNRLTREWESRRTSMLKTKHQTSLGATIELSIASPMFRELGPDARGLLEVVAFYPQGINESNVNWLFPTIPDISHIFDKFCNLSLTYRSNGFVAMLAPLRDHLGPKNPELSAPLCETRECYFSRLSVTFSPDQPGFKDEQWIISEDVNVEHLLNVFITTTPVPNEILDACLIFIQLLICHKPRQTVLRLKVEELPDDNIAKLECLAELGTLAGAVGNRTEQSRLLNHALKLAREGKDDVWVGYILMNLSDFNRTTGNFKEAIGQAREALEIHERLGGVVERVWCLHYLALSLREDGQLDAAEETTIRALELLPEKGEEHLTCASHRFLGIIYQSKGETKKAIHHFEVALGIASTLNWHASLFWIHYGLANLSLDRGAPFDDANTRIQQAKSYSLNNAYYQGRASHLQAKIWYRERKFEDATSEARLALETFERVGATDYIECCRTLLRNIERTSSATGPP